MNTNGPDFEKLTDKFFNRLMDHRNDPLHQDENYFPGTEVGKVLDDLCNDLWTTHVEPLQAELNKIRGALVMSNNSAKRRGEENQKLREQLKVVKDSLDTYGPHPIIDSMVEKLLKLDKD